MPSYQHSVAVLPLVDNQSAFWSLHPCVYGKTFPAFPFSAATATVAMERKNGHGMVETGHKRAALILINKNAPLILNSMLNHG